MDKLLKFSKIAAYTAIVLLVAESYFACKRLFFDATFTLTPELFIGIIQWLIFVIWCGWLCQASNSGTSIRNISVVGIIVSVLQLCLVIFYNIPHTGVHWEVYAVVSIVQWVACIGFAFALIWLSKYFSTKLTIITIIMALFPLLREIISLIILNINYDYYIEYYHLIWVPILKILFYISSICFFFTFNKLNQSK